MQIVPDRPAQSCSRSRTGTIPFGRFIEYVIAPHVSNLLIAEDQGTTIEKAEDIRVCSADYGKTMNGDDADSECHDILSRNDEARRKEQKTWALGYRSEPHEVHLRSTFYLVF